MAKPKHASNLNHRSVECAFDNSFPYLRRLHQDKRLHPSTSYSSAPSPSSAVLSALAIIAASPTTVAGSPVPVQTTPPVFLCPHIERDIPNLPTIPTIPTIPPIPAHAVPRASTPTSTYKPVYLDLSRRIADKYIQGMDNRWRKTDEWTLYGSTCCASSTSSPNVNDVQAWPLKSSAASSASSSPLELDASVLPAGWQTSSSGQSSAESTIILVLAIIIAISLCIFMVACVFWRNSKRKKLAKEDPEVKLRHKLRPDDESEYGEQEREARDKMRVWAKATARWKANIRHSAARRRRKRQARGGRPQSPAPSEHPDIPPASPSRPSVERLPSPGGASGSKPSVAIPTAEGAPAIPVSQDSPEVSLPPAYRPPASRPHSTLHCYASVADLGPSASRRQSLLSDPGSLPSHSREEPAPYVSPMSGHIAVDDKGRLCDLGNQASAPDPESSANAPSSSVVVSVPAWDDLPDELDGDPELEPYSAPVSMPLPPSFPPLPSKGMLTSVYLYGDAYLYENGNAHPAAPDEVGQLTASAPPIEGPCIEPSAPSLEDDENEAQPSVEHLPIITGHSSPSNPLPTSSHASSPPSLSARDGIPPSYRP
ncbi:hypothetical protein ID866_3996 [Astraeus odoratus]|nr:hypothetical protein ID866_3996 [Astraeus odoratus]